MANGWVVPFEYVLVLVSAFIAVLSLLWLGVVVRVFVNNERRIVTLETYFDPRNEEMRRRLLVAEFAAMVSQLELRLGKDLEQKRASIESTIKQQVSEVVDAVRKNGE